MTELPYWISTASVCGLREGNLPTSLLLGHKIQVVRDVKTIQARHLASIVGKIISMGLAIGPVSRFMTQSMYALLETRNS